MAAAANRDRQSVRRRNPGHRPHWQSHAEKIPRVQDAIPGNPQRAWQRRANPVLINPLHLAPQSTMALGDSDETHCSTGKAGPAADERAMGSRRRARRSPARSPQPGRFPIAVSGGGFTRARDAVSLARHTVLPGGEVTYYDVPPEYGIRDYRYAV